jgi:hypothetical protein
VHKALVLLSPAIANAQNVMGKLKTKAGLQKPKG